jgi:hypothetical protein
VTDLVAAYLLRRGELLLSLRAPVREEEVSAISFLALLCPVSGLRLAAFCLFSLVLLFS